MTETTETVRLDAGGPYRWNVGEVAVAATTTVCAECDDIHIDVSVFPDGDETGTPAQVAGRISLDPWTVTLEAETLPAEVASNVSELIDSYRGEVEIRGGRMLRARDRELWQKEDLTGLNPSVLVRYRSLFPADFDIVLVLDDRAHYVEDFHCLINGCTCTTVALMVTQIDDDTGETTELGSVTLDVGDKPPKPEGARSVAALVRRMIKETPLLAALVQRRDECRRIAPAVAKRIAPPKAPVRSKVGRNAPCPCGSGKKHKKCCLGK